MRMRFRGVVVGLTLLAAPLSTLADSSADAFTRIERLLSAARTLNYDATFVYSHGGKIDEMRIIHRYADGVERERLVTLSGTTREVLRDDTRVTCIIPDRQAVVVGKSRPQALYGSAVLTGQGYEDYYSLGLEGDGRVAGRAAEIVGIRPRDEFRYGYRLWVDKASGLLLRSELRDEKNQVLESIVYLSLNTPEHIPDTLLEPEISGNGFSWYTNTSSKTSTTQSSEWIAGWLPPGFIIRARESTPLPEGRMPLEHFVYGDGLASLSIYIEQLDANAKSLEGISRMGAMSAYGTMVGQYQVTVVGEVPGVTVRNVGRSVKRAR